MAEPAVCFANGLNEGGTHNETLFLSLKVWKLLKVVVMVMVVVLVAVVVVVLLLVVVVVVVLVVGEAEAEDVVEVEELP
jgi:hypothetical protein